MTLINRGQILRRVLTTAAAVALTVPVSVAWWAAPAMAETTTVIDQFGTASFDVGRALATDSSKNVYVAGQVGAALPGQTGVGSYDGYLRKYTSSGSLDWTRQFGTAGDDDAYSVAVDSSGNIYVAGRTSSTLADCSPAPCSTAGGRDAFVRQYTASGSVGWTRQLGTASSDETTGLAVAGNYVYVAGQTTGAFAGYTNTAADINGFVRQYGTDGTEGWTRQLQGTQTDGTETWTTDNSADDIGVDGSGNVYVSGTENGTLDSCSPAPCPDTGGDSYDGFVRQYTSSGTIGWTRVFGPTTAANTNWVVVAVDGSGNVDVGGGTHGALPGSTSSGGEDAFVRQYTSAGGLVWERQFGTTVDDDVELLAVDSTGNIYAAGGWNDDQQLVWQFNAADGTEGWSRQFAGINFNGVAVDASTNLYATGDTYGALPGYANAGDYDAFLLRLAPSPAVATSTELVASPEPSTLGASVTYTATVTPVSGTLDAGTVTFYEGTTVVCQDSSVDTSTGEATCETDYAASGSHVVRAAYSGTAAFDGSWASVTHTVKPVIDLGGGVANAVSGTIVVGSNAARDHAYAWDLATDPRTAIDLGNPLGTSQALAVDGTLAVGESGGHAYAWDLADDPPTGIDLGDPLNGGSDASHVSGTFAAGHSGSHAYAWDLSTDPPTGIDLGNPVGGDFGNSDVYGLSGTVAVGESSGHAYAWNLATDPPTGIDLGTPLGGDSRATGVDGDLVVGDSSNADDTAQHAYAWNLTTDPPTVIDLGNPLGGISGAHAADGSFAVGDASNADDTAQHAYAWDLTTDPPTVIDLGNPLGGSTFAEGLDGNFAVGASQPAGGSEKAYAWDLTTDPPTVIDLGSYLDGDNLAVAVSGNIAVGTENSSSYSAEAYAWKLTHAPSAPNASLSTVGDGSVTIEWTAPADDGGSAVSGYNVYLGTAPGGESSTAVNTDPLPASTTSLTVPSLTNSTTYYLTVKALNGVGEGRASNEVMAIPGAPSPPTNLTITKTKGKAATTTLSWTDQGLMITDHEVIVYRYQKATKQNPTPTYDPVGDPIAVSGTSTPVTGLLGKYTYVFKVNATNTAGTSEYSNYSSTFRG